MPGLNFNHDTIILDASPLICLYASGQMRNILSSIPKSVTVAAYVKNIEAKSIYNQPIKDMEQPIEAIQLDSIIGDGLLKVVDLDTEEEAMTVLDLVTIIGQGEAITGAIAEHRGWSIAVDDKKARRIFSNRIPHLPLLWTLDLLIHWQSTANPTADEVQLALENIRDRSRYQPKASHPHYNWWSSCIKSSNS